MKEAVRKALTRAGWYLKKYKNLPGGVDWIYDAERILKSPPGMVFDIGANSGQTMREIKGRWPDAMVHCFEPVSSTYASLEKAAREYTKVSCHHVALSNETGSRTLRVVPNEVRNSLKSDRMAKLDTAVTETIEITTADSFCASHSIERVDILKTDTEGNDLEVLLGAENLLKKRAIRLVYAEATFLIDDNTHSNFFSLFDLLRKNGFALVGLYEQQTLFRRDNDDSYCNAFFALV